MNLRELIEQLEEADQSKMCAIGFKRPHSYRGNYSELAFEPALGIRVSTMLSAAQSALGSTYEGWKGGDYTMSASTECYLAPRGSTGVEISADLLVVMIESDFLFSRFQTGEWNECECDGPYNFHSKATTLSELKAGNGWTHVELKSEPWDVKEGECLGAHCSCKQFKPKLTCPMCAGTGLMDSQEETDD